MEISFFILNKTVYLKEILRIHVKKCFLQCAPDKTSQDFFFFIKALSVITLLIFSCVIALYAMANSLDSIANIFDTHSSETEKIFVRDATVSTVNPPEIVHFTFYLSSTGNDIPEIHKILDDGINKIKNSIHLMNKNILIVSTSYEIVNKEGIYTKVTRRLSFWANFNEKLTFKIIEAARKSNLVEKAILKYDLFYTKASSFRNVRNLSFMQAMKEACEAAQKSGKTVKDSNVDKEDLRTMPELFEFSDLSALSEDFIGKLEQNINIPTQGKITVQYRTE